MTGLAAPYQTTFAPTDRGAILAGIRRGQVPHRSPPVQIPPLQQVLAYGGNHQFGPNFSPQVQFAYLAQQHQTELNLVRQTNEVMELQLQQMRLQSLEIQERLMVAAHHQPPAPIDPGRRRTETYNSLKSASYSDLSFSAQQHALEERRDALQGLQRASQQRSVSAQAQSQTAGVEGRFAQPRLSFQPPVMVPGIGRQGGQHRHSHSVVSNTSSNDSVLSGSRTLLASPTGPTLVLSKPGESYTPSPVYRPKRTSLSSEDSDTSLDSTSSEVASFESTTSVGSGSTPIKLNPDAPVFQPPIRISTPPVRTRPVIVQSGSPRGAIPVRQPRGPAKDEDLPAKNFASRIRRRAIGAILGRRPSPVPFEA